MKSMANAKAMGAYGLHVERLKLGVKQDRTFLLELHRLITHIWRKGKVPKQFKDAIITVLHKENEKTECDNYCGISLVSHAGKVIPKSGCLRLLCDQGTVTGFAITVRLRDCYRRSSVGFNRIARPRT